MAAINVVDDLTLEAVLAAATELESPLIVQTSVKTVKSIGAERAVRDVARPRRRGAGPGDAAPRPLPRPRVDHRSACRRGWNSVLFDGSELDVAENTRQTIEVVAEAERHGAHVEGEIESVLGVEDGVGSDEAGVGAPGRGLGAFHRGHRASTRSRPAIGTAHGLYKAAPELKPERVTELVELQPIPMVLHGGTGLTAGAVLRPDRARLRQGQHLDRAEDRVRRGAPRVPRGQPRQARSAVAAQARARRREGRWPSTTSGCSARPDAPAPLSARPADAVPALIFDCDGVLADTERDGHRPAFNQTFAEVGPAGALVRARSTARSSGSAAARSAWPRCSRRSSSRRTACPTDPEGQRELLADWHQRKTAPTRRWSRRPAARRARDRADRPARRIAAGWTLAVASTSAEESVRAVLEHAVGSRRRRALRGVRRRRRPRQEARPGDLPARARAARRSARTTRS